MLSTEDYYHFDYSGGGSVTISVAFDAASGNNSLGPDRDQLLYDLAEALEPVASALAEAPATLLGPPRHVYPVEDAIEPPA